jgi:hypothetical protein
MPLLDEARQEAQALLACPLRNAEEAFLAVASLVGYSWIAWSLTIFLPDAVKAPAFVIFYLLLMKGDDNDGA